MPSDFMAIDGTVSNLTASNPKAAEDQELSSSKASKEQNGVLPAQVWSEANFLATLYDSQSSSGYE